jgi:hypothetical protein
MLTEFSHGIRQLLTTILSMKKIRSTLRCALLAMSYLIARTLEGPSAAAVVGVNSHQDLQVFPAGGKGGPA